MANRWTELAERLEKATGPDREIDILLAKRMNKPNGYREVVHYESRSIDVHEEIALRYTSSIDAIIALIEETLPGWVPSFRGGDDTCRNPELRMAQAQLEPCLRNDSGWATGRKATMAATPALALCAVFCWVTAAQLEPSP